MLRSEVSRGQAADRKLADRLGRRRPERPAPEASYLDALAAGEEERSLVDPELVAAAKAGDASARARLVEALMPLISSLARIYRGGSIQRQELLQEGVVGALRALERFDPERGTPFWAYAGWWVRQAMQQLVSELTGPIVLSDRALRRMARLKDAHREAILDVGRQPERADLARRAGLTLDQVDDLLATERTPRSLDEPISDQDGQVGTFGDLLVDPLAEDEYERVLSAIEVEQLHGLLAGLSERERDVLRRRYGLDGDEQSLRQIGGTLGLSAERIRQIETRALAKLASIAYARPAPAEGGVTGRSR